MYKSSLSDEQGKYEITSHMHEHAFKKYSIIVTAKNNETNLIHFQEKIIAC